MLLLLMSQVLVPVSGPSAIFTACVENAAGVSTEMLACGRAEIARVDARLNAAYRALMRTLSTAERAKLRATQRAWLQRHLEKTQRLAADPSEGSVAFLNSQSFELQDLSARTALLERMVARRR